MVDLKHRVVFTGKEIIEYAYLAKEHLEELIEKKVQLRFEQANCYYACFCKCKHLLGVTDLREGEHCDLQDFFNHWLSREGDILIWVTEKEFKALNEGRRFGVECPF
jgi:uncharacterized protein (UPF0332 family)